MPDLRCKLLCMNVQKKWSVGTFLIKSVVVWALNLKKE